MGFVAEGIAELADDDLAIVGNVGDDPGDEIQIIYPFHFFSSFSIHISMEYSASIRQRPGQPLTIRQSG